MRKKIVAGNWKMNLTFDDAVQLHQEIDGYISHNDSIQCEVYQFVPSIYLNTLLSKNKKVHLGVQNAYPAKKGAFTGEISMFQVAGLKTNAVLVGHSERRHIFGESNAFLKQKIDAALAENLQPFFCCGEDLALRESGKFENFVIQQLKESLFHLNKEDFSKIVIAYEPIWAIGTGKTATPEQANAMHKAIRVAIRKNYDWETAENISILYGGSCNPSNASSLFSQSDIDGGLIGGASLKTDDFTAIIQAY